MKQLTIILCFFILLSSNQAFAQIPPPSLPSAEKDSTKNRVIIDKTDVFTGEQDLNTGVITKVLEGNVVLRQDDVIMYCDRAVMIDNQITAGGNVIIQQGDSIATFADSLVYNGDTRFAELIGEVVLKDGASQLFVPRLDYDMNTKIGKYTSEAILVNGDTKLTSKRGYYHADTHEAFFKDSVIVTNPEYSLSADTLKINTETNLITFLGPTNIFTKDSYIYCEKGFYDNKKSYAEFEQNARFRSQDKKATANKIRYDAKKEMTYLEGNAKYSDDTQNATADEIIYSGKTQSISTNGKTIIKDGEQTIIANQSSYDDVTGIAHFKDNVQVLDGEQTLTADNLDYNKNSKLGTAFGNVYWEDTTQNITIRCERADYSDSTGSILASGRPFLTNILDGDTLYLVADTLYAYKKENNDSQRVMIAYQDVRMFKSDLQAVCDSLSYDTSDSLFVFYKDPIIWSDTTQFSADTVRIQLANQRLDRIYMYNKSLIINTTNELYFNQVKGKYITAIFQAEELRRMEVEGSGQSIYYVQDEAKAFTGVNKTDCGEMKLFFGNNKVDKIKFYSQPKATLFPMGQVSHQSLRLQGFRWEKERRPMSVEDLLE